MSRRQAALAVVVYAAAGVLGTWPLARLAADHIFSRGSPDDVLLVLWILAWDAHALATAPARLFAGNIFHPAPDVLAHSEHLLGTLPLFAPWYAATGNPVLGMNLMMLASFVLGGLFMHALMWACTRSTVAAYTAGLSFALAPWRINGLNWPHLLTTQYLPLVLLGLRSAVTAPRPRASLLLAVALTLQLLSSYYLAYMAAVVVAAFLLVHLIQRRFRLPRAAWTALATGLLPPIVLLVLVSVPYLNVARAGILRWNPPDPALDALATLGSPAFVLSSFVGWWLTPLAVVGLGTLLRRDPETRAMTWTLAVILAVALSVAPGPRGLFGGTVAPYSWLAAVVPGFSLVRVTFRFGILTGFAVSALAGFGAWQIAGAVSRAAHPIRIAAAAVVVGCALYPGLRTRVPPPRPLPIHGAVPAAYEWLAANGRGEPLLELPMSERPADSGWAWGRAGARAMYFSIYHWLPLLNGYTGYPPAPAAVAEEIARGLPREDALETLVSCTGLRWILVRRLRTADQTTWAQARQLRFVGGFSGVAGDERLYEVVDASRSPCRDSRFPAARASSPN